jgi:hypothetical protein
MRTHRHAARAVVLAGLLSVVLLGETQAPRAQMLMQAVAICVAVLLAGRPMLPVGRGLRILGPLLLAATAILGFEIMGMYRWIRISGFSVNTSALVVPPLIAMMGRDPRPANAWAALIAALALAVQPAPVAATALAVGVAFTRGIRPRGLTLGVCVLAAAVAWWRDVPLDPVPHVEQIARLAYAAGWAWTLLIPVIVGLMVWSAATWALRATLLIFAFAPFIGAWPVPFAGVGASIWIGAGLAIGLSIQAHPPASARNRMT